MPKPYRSRSRLVFDVLRAISSEAPVQVTRLLLVANLTHPRLMEQLDGLKGRGWIVERAEEGRRSWALTDEGRRALRKLVEIETAMEDFGLAL